MVPERSKDQKQGLSRRDFLIGSAALGGSVGVVSALGIEPKEAEAKAYSSVDDMIEINPDEFERFDAIHSAFGIGLAYAPPIPDKPGLVADQSFIGHGPIYAGLLEQDENDDPTLVEMIKNPDGIEHVAERGTPGFTRIDNVYRSCASTTQDLAGEGRDFGWKSTTWIPNREGKLVPHTFWGQSAENFGNHLDPHWFDVAEEQWEFDNPEQASYAIKKVAKVFGADLVGIAPYDERFVYKTHAVVPRDMERNTILEKVDLYEPLDMGFTPKSVIVLGFEMDYETVKLGSAWSVGGAIGRGYSRMVTETFHLTKFLRDLGYQTFHCGNTASQSVAEAIRAGLGEAGRNGLLITPEYGPRVRISKIYTDCEFEYDKPQSFGVTEFCEVCQVCADACPSESIPHCSINDPENKPFNRSNQPGVKKYYVNTQSCFAYWKQLFGGCNNCVTVCPYNKPKTWNHDLVKLVTRVPGLNSFARYFDAFFGYGGLATSEDMYNYWRKEI